MLQFAHQMGNLLVCNLLRRLFPPMNCKVGWLTILTLMLGGPMGAGAGDDCWNGTITQRDGVTYVHNAARSNCPPRIYDMVPKWSLTSDETDGFVFGAIVDAVMHPTGVLCLLDQQLKTVHKISPLGEYLGSIGEEGEGPGEMRLPGALFLRSDGVIGVVDISGQCIVFLGIDGEHVGDWRPNIAGYPRVHPLNAQEIDEGYVVTLEMHRLVNGRVEDVVMVAACNEKGDMRGELLRQSILRDSPRVMLFDEVLADAKVLLGVDAADGVFVAQSFEDYVFARFDGKGLMTHQISRDVEPWRRSAQTKNDIESYWRALYARYEEVEIILSDCERMVHGVIARPDGEVWVETARGWYDTVESANLFYDIYDADARYLCAGHVQADMRRDDDSVFLLQQEILVVKAGSLYEGASVEGGFSTGTGTEGVTVPEYGEIVLGDLLRR